MEKKSDSILYRQFTKKDKFYLCICGFAVRIFCLILTFLIFANNTDLNDMVEKVAAGINYFISGQNPFGNLYFLHAGAAGPFTYWYVDFFYQYPPLSFLAYLPTLIYPNSMYPLDFSPSFYIMNLCIDFYIFYRLINYKIRWPAMIFWANPLFGMLLDFNTIISLPLLFLTLGLLNKENPTKNALYLGLSTLAYTYSIIVLAFFFFYYFDKENIKKFFLGLLIPLIIFGIFLIWNPRALISDLIFSQFGHPPYSFETTPYGIPVLHVTSIPPYIYTYIKPHTFIFYPSSIGVIPYVNGFLGIYMGGFNITPYMYIISLGIAVYLLFKYFIYQRKDLYYTIGYPFIILGLLVISSPGGYAHYTIIPLLVAIFAWRQREEHKKGNKK